MKYLLRNFCKQPLRAVLKKGVPKIQANSLRNNYEGFDFSVKLYARMLQLYLKGTPAHAFFKELTFLTLKELTNWF